MATKPFRNNCAVLVVLFLLQSGFGICQDIFIQSITVNRQSAGDNGYTLDGSKMTAGARLKLLEPANFGPSGTYTKSVGIFDSYEESGSLTQVSNVPTDHIFFFGNFDLTNSSTNLFTPGEIDDLYDWSLKGGKVIITCGQEYVGSFDSQILNSKWDYSCLNKNPSYFAPTSEGLITDIFIGPFGNVSQANQGEALQSYYGILPADHKVLATSKDGEPTLVLDCKTLDLLVADVDAFTENGGISSGSGIDNSQDSFWANTIVFMDRLQGPPFLTQNNNALSVNAIYNNYQWYKNDTLITGETGSELLAGGTGSFFVEVTLNGGCKLKSDIIVAINDSLSRDCDIFVPSAFSPDQNGLNDKACVYGPCIKEIEFSVYDRWGERVFFTKDQSKCWDGIYKGERAVNAVFAWTIKAKLKSGKSVIKKGNITAIR